MLGILLHNFVKIYRFILHMDSMNLKTSSNNCTLYQNQKLHFYSWETNEIVPA